MSFIWFLYRFLIWEYDETDKKFYEVFKFGKAKYLITGNIKHFPKEKGLVTPKEFFENL